MPKHSALLQMAVEAALDPGRKRPYINNRGESVIAVNTGMVDAANQPIYREQRVANATLRKDDWIQLDRTILETAKERLVIVSDLMSLGLTYSVGGLGTIITEWERQGELTDAEITMDGESQTDEDRLEFDLQGVPIPIIQKRFRIGERQLLASRRNGSGLDVSTGAAAALSVARTSENLVFNGSPNIGAVDSYSIYGLTNFPGRTLDTMLDWSLVGTDPQEILADILGFVQTMETTKHRYGPFYLYVPTAYAYRFREDFKANGDKTLMQRVLDTGVIKEVRFSDVLAVGNVLMIQMTPDVIDLAIASDVTTIQWASPSGWANYFQMFAAWAPRLKADKNGSSGILHATIGT